MQRYYSIVRGELINFGVNHENQLASSELELGYFSLMCRNGPLPERYLHCTDMLCIFIFVLLGIFVFIIACIDWSQVTSQTVTSETSANTVPIINQFLIDMVLAALTAIATGIIISLLAIFIPNFMSIFMVLFLLLSFLGIALLALWDFKKDDHSIEWLVVIVLSFSSFIVASVIIYRRRMKIKHFGYFLKMSGIFIKSNLAFLCGVTIGLSLLDIGLWCLMAVLYKGFTEVDLNATLSPFWGKFAVIVLWLWIHGLLIAISDYLFQAYVVNCFYTQYKNKMDYSQRNSKENISLSSKMRTHIGTILFGSVVTYIPEFVQSFLRRATKDRLPELLSSLSRYGYLATIMYYIGFQYSSIKIKNLRKRIKTTIPEMYMVGHLFGDIFKLLISMVSIAILSALMNNKQAGIFEFVIMALLTGAGLALEIGNNFSNLSATSGDICYMLYCIDIEIERVYYQSSEPYSTPLEILYVLRPLMIQRNWNGRLPYEIVEGVLNLANKDSVGADLY